MWRNGTIKYNEQYNRYSAPSTNYSLIHETSINGKHHNNNKGEQYRNENFPLRENRSKENGPKKDH